MLGKSRIVIAVCFVASCTGCPGSGANSGESSSGSTTSTTTTTHDNTGHTDTSPPAAPPCMPPGLDAARPVTMWTMPTGCTRSSNNGGSPPAIAHDEAELRAQVTCPAGVTLGVDFAQHEVVIRDSMMSPAYAGGSIVDDGQKVTFVTRFRMPCTQGAHPMPGSMTASFLLPAGATREFAEATCTMPSNCP